MNYSRYVALISPYIVKIKTQTQFGTGFVFWQNDEFCCIGTASHVIEPAVQPGWEQPIVVSQQQGISLRIYPEHRIVFSNLDEGDSAAVIIRKSGLNLPCECLPLMDTKEIVPIGHVVHWIGFPTIISEEAKHRPSFFSGVISNYFAESKEYVIDGVAIHGTSGGPVFYRGGKAGKIRILGSISSYKVNRVRSTSGTEYYPGLAFAHSFSAFDPLVDGLDRLDAVRCVDAP
ncbi:hypothetical protein MTYM_01918 [Methylococcales bacterium]|nr:hypothetical protein MTYM_01918 [Methylococcales bacterium]